MIFYSSNGHPIAYSEDQKILYLFSGKPVAYLHCELVYAFNGTQLGRYEKGWVRDLKGYCVLLQMKLL